MEADEDLKSQISNLKSAGRRRTGTREWAPITKNIQLGCEHDCRYCYARYNAVSRYHWCTREQWCQPKIDAARVDRSYGRMDGAVMFPSTHDITKRNVTECLVVLRKLLEAGNELLLVSKPDIDVIDLLCASLKRWQSHVTFRFTIGSILDQVLAFWEPGAPDFKSRHKSLMSCYFDGWRTSVSCEPYLDPWPQHVFEACYDYLSDDPRGGFWIGKLRQWDARVDLTGATEEQIRLYVEPLKAAQGDDAVRGLVRMLDGRKFIRWKDSIREVIEKEPQINADERRSTKGKKNDGLRKIDNGID